jgi:hypothetical protein
MDSLQFINKLKEINLKDDLSRLEQCDVIFFCHDVDRPITLNHKAYSPLIDSVREKIEAIGLKCISVAHPFSRLVSHRSHGGVIAINKSYLFFSIRNKINKKLKKNLFKNHNLYAEIIEKTKVKLIITIGAPDALSNAAHALGVLNVELLHGLGYVEPQWGWLHKGYTSLPKAILSLDNISSEGFSPLLQKGVTIKTIPHPFLSRYLPKNKHLLPDEWLFTGLQLTKYRKAILVSLQWAYAGDHGEYTQFKNILENGLFFPEIEEMVKNRPDVFWFFRLHPVQLLNSKYRRLIKFLKDFASNNKNCEWNQASYLPYPSIAMLCSGNIGMSSQSSYDAAAMGVPSLMLCPTVQPGNIHGDWFLDLVEEGYVTKAMPDLDVINDWVDRVEPKQPRLSNLEDDAAWEDALQWMLEESALSSKFQPVHE